MASEGPLTAGTGANNASAGNAPFNSPGNITASDNTYSTTAGIAAGTSWHTVQLIIGGTRSGSNLASGALPAGSGNEQFVAFGSSSSLWGLTPSYSDINASNFGAAFRVNIGGGFTSQYLHATNYGFAIPTGATIDGIVVEIECYADGSGGSGFFDSVRITVHYTAGGGSQGAAMHYYRQCQRHEQPRLILPDRELITELPPRFNRLENRLAT